MVHRLDVRTVGVEHVGAVVARVVVPLARTAVVAPARRESCLVEAVDGLAIRRLERDVEPGCGLSVVADEELVDCEPTVPPLISNPSGASAPA